MLSYRYYLPVILQDGVTLSPSPPPPQDSLPWAVYKLGDYKGASLYRQCLRSVYTHNAEWSGVNSFTENWRIVYLGICWIFASSFVANIWLTNMSLWMLCHVLWDVIFATFTNQHTNWKIPYMRGEAVVMLLHNRMPLCLETKWSCSNLMKRLGQIRIWRYSHTG